MSSSISSSFPIIDMHHHHHNPQRERRLERNRESARECRRRKRDRILFVEERCKVLEKENMELRSQLQAGKEAMKREEAEKTQICQELEAMVLPILIHDYVSKIQNTISNDACNHCDAYSYNRDLAVYIID
jgi:hypothetical protein